MMIMAQSKMMMKSMAMKIKVRKISNLRVAKRPKTRKRRPRRRISTSITLKIGLEMNTQA